MNICCLTRITLSHASKGGMEVHVKTLSEGLVHAGHKVTIITTEHPAGLEHESRNSVEIFYCKETPSGQYTEDWGRASLKLLADIHRAEPFDIIWGEGGGAYYYIRSAKKVLNIPVATILQGSFLADMRSQISELKANKNLALLFIRQFPKRVIQYLKRDLVFARGADAVIGSSLECARDARWEYLLPKDRIFATVNGINVQRFAPMKSGAIHLRERIGIKNSASVILTASRLIRGKGIHLLIQAMPEILKEVPNAILLIAGSGPGEKSLKQLAETLKIGKNVIFLGYVENEELADFYNLCDVFVYPTLLYESFGISVAEAMSCGKPVIAAKSGGILTSIDNEVNGFLYKPHRKDQLVSLCIRVLNNPQEMLIIRKSAREKAHNFLSAERMVCDVEKIFKSLT